MQIIIKSRQMQVTPQLRQRIERKVQRLSRLVDGESRVEVTVAEEQTRSLQDRFSVQLALSGNPCSIRSEVSAFNASAALDLVLDKVVTQLGRHKDRQTTARRLQDSAVRVLALSRSGDLSAVDGAQHSTEDHFDRSVGEDNEEIWSRVMEIRRLPAKPMNDRQVIAQMEKSSIAFFPFFNEATNSVNVMYKLDAGGYGLLIPAVE